MTTATARFLLLLITAVFGLRLAAMLAVTPLGEGLDAYNHWAYVIYLAEQGRPPSPAALTVPAWMSRLEEALPGPDTSHDGRRYRAWAARRPHAQAEADQALQSAAGPPAYARTNSQSQHPPLYYWLLSRVYRALPAGLGLEARLYLLGLLSIVAAALAVPGLYQTLRLHLAETPALLAVLALAWYPNLLPFLARVSNDTLAMPLMVWGVYFCLRTWQTQHARDAAAAGIVLALACFTKTYALTLLPLYGLCAWAGADRPRAYRNTVVAAVFIGASLAALFAYNAAVTGHLIPLTEMRSTAAVPLAVRLAALLQVDPIWLVGGLIKGFWWLGFWSFVSPGLFYYLPLAALLWLLAAPPRWQPGPPDRLALRTLWPHYGALALFAGGMLWHAAMFTLAARLHGQTAHSGNEGWYANVLLGSAAAIVCVLLQHRLRPAAFHRALAGSVAFFVLWNALAVAAMIAYWGGAVGVSGRLRAVPVSQLIPALLVPETWASWLSLPGIMAPAALTGLAPLLLALGGTALALQRLSQRPPVAAETTVAAAEAAHA